MDMTCHFNVIVSAHCTAARLLKMTYTSHVYRGVVLHYYSTYHDQIWWAHGEMIGD